MSSQKTPNLNMNKWTDNDYVLVEEINQNFDTIDEKFGDVTSQLAQTNNKFLSNEFELIAHRGLNFIAPENTLPAYQEAARFGIRSFECDVQISADGIPVLIHDDTVDRTTDGSGFVKDKSLIQLKELDASKLKPFYSFTPIPTFEEFLQFSQGNAKYIYPEIKGYRTIEDVRLITSLIKKYGFETRCILQSFWYDGTFPIVREESDTIILGYGVNNQNAFNDALSKAEQDGNAVIITDYNIIINNPNFVELAKSKGIDIVVYVIDAGYLFKKLTGLGVNRIMSNRLYVGGLYA